MRNPPPEPIREALVRPSLWFGCDPVLLMALGTICGTVGVGGGVGFREPWLSVLGFLLFTWGKTGLQKLAKVDPQLRQIIWRRRRYAPAYDSRARWDAPAKRWSAWT